MTDKRILDSIATYIGCIALVFAVAAYVRTLDNKEVDKVEKYWISEEIVCFKQGERFLNCEYIRI